MITKMTGTLTRVLDDEARVEVGPFEYQVLISEANRRSLQLRLGQDVTFHVSEYYEGNQSGTRLVPRKIGFLSEHELAFFDLFCTVDKIGAKKALKAMARGVREIADAVNRGDTKWLTTLPGIGGATAEQIVTSLKRKITPFLVQRSTEVEVPPADAVASAEKKPRGKGKPVAPPELPLAAGPSERATRRRRVRGADRPGVGAAGSPRPRRWIVAQRQAVRHPLRSHCHDLRHAGVKPKRFTAEGTREHMRKAKTEES